MRNAGVGVDIFTKIICEACCKHPNECLTMQDVHSADNVAGTEPKKVTSCILNLNCFR